MPAKKTGLGPFSRFLLSALVGGVLTLFVVGALWFADSALTDVDKPQRFEQPAEITYADNSTHYVGLVERRSGLFGQRVTHEIYSGRAPDMSYGHLVDIGITGADSPRIGAVTWVPEGVRVRFESGHEVFIPAEKFTFGR